MLAAEQMRALFYETSISTKCIPTPKTRARSVCREHETSVHIYWQQNKRALHPHIKTPFTESCYLNRRTNELDSLAQKFDELLLAVDVISVDEATREECQRRPNRSFDVTEEQIKHRHRRTSTAVEVDA